MGSVDHIVKETLDVLSIYAKRLEVLGRVFMESGDDNALQTSEELRKISAENSAARKRLERAIESNQRDVLADVWNVSRMKEVYHPVLKKFSESVAVCASWKNKPEILARMDMENRAIMKDDFHRYVNTTTFPTVVKDHLFHLLTLLTKYNSKLQTPVLRRIQDLIQWLDKEQPTLSGIKGIAPSAIPSTLKSVNELVLKMDTFRLPKCGSKDAAKCDVILSARHVIIRTRGGNLFRKDETVEHQAVAKIKLQEAYDSTSFELLGVGFTKVLTAESPQIRDDWMQSIREVQKAY
ncbi:uncharacterized protein LOC100903119 [Galendromus occidentalis]|uniref:Uncharacterized protein LOC100903119 n=1 Tax=Galendromus occidentalis TaxID=34638 RepID=A0AAJ6QPJ9_9ACAR|nr:uncharacterized protein LOC100903119 [Galendromus occidentalis]XP_018494371.1 uncharacterized protein LOC100903119 [Galendromus occidentalis]